MKYLSLFSGIGGFELGIQQAYETLRQLQQKVPRQQNSQDTKNERGLFNGGQPTCIGYSEIDKYAIQIYEKHFKHKNYGDCSKIKTEDLPEFDLLVGGFPCQAFSIAGKRGGFSDTRGTMFFDIARIIREKQPRLLLLENVKGLLSHDEGRTFTTIIATLDELGYDLQWQVLNSKNFGVPQNRERVFIVGNSRGTSRPQVFPITQGSQGNLKYSGGVISAREQWLKDGKTNSRNFSQGQRIYGTDGISQTLAGNAGGQGGKTGLYEVANTIDVNYYKGINRNKGHTSSTSRYGNGTGSHIFAPNGKEIDVSNAPSNPFQLLEVRTDKGKQTRREIRQAEGRDSTKRGKEDKKYIPKTDDTANCLTTGKENIEKWLFKESKIRRLTPTECERLQGFPDGWTEGVSDTQRYKCLGNAVTVNVIKAITCNII